MVDHFRISAFLVILIAAILVVSLPAGESGCQACGNALGHSVGELVPTGDVVSNDGSETPHDEHRNRLLYVALYAWNSAPSGDTASGHRYRACILFTPTEIAPDKNDSMSFCDLGKNYFQGKWKVEMHWVNPWRQDLRGLLLVTEVPKEITPRKLESILVQNSFQDNIGRTGRPEGWPWVQFALRVCIIIPSVSSSC